MTTFLRGLLIVLCALASASGAAPAATTAGGTSIANTATATYSDKNNTTISVASNTITATVESVSSVVTGPNEQGCNPKTDSVVTGQTFVRTFTINNASNITDTYTVAASATAGSIVSLAYVANGTTVPLGNGAAIPTPLAPGATAQVVVTANPGQAAVGSNIEITLVAKSTASNAVNGEASSTSQQCAIVAGAAAISGPTGTGTLVSKLVNGVSFAQTTPGSTVTYSISFTNTGGVPATNVVMTDVVPPNVTPIAGSVLVNGSTPVAGTVAVSGQTLTVKIASLPVATPQTITFSATVGAAAVMGGTIVNTASVAADNAVATASVPASLLVGSGNVVYDGLGGQSQTVAGAVLTLVNPSTKQPIVLSGTPFAPNTTNANPFTTTGGGTYAFGLAPNQTGSTSYLLTIVAPGYENRQITVTLTPTTSGLYNVTLTALDGQLLAAAGTFALTGGPVTLDNVYGIFGNIPLFRTQSVQITKTVDRSFAATGDRLVYTLEFSNVGSTLAATTIVDTLPPGLFYAPGTGRVDKIPQEPVKVGRTLTWTLPSLSTAHTITYAVVIMPGTADYTTLTNVATVTALAPNDPALKISATASVDTRIVPGVFTDSTIITGRVFYDARRTGFFVKGDVGIPRVRIFLEDGESVLTDIFGRYSFPAVKPGMHVLRVDTTSLPPDAHPYADRSYDSERSIRRLVHGVFDGGLIQDINFALEGSPQS